MNGNDLRETLNAVKNQDERALQSLLVENLPALEMFIRLKAGKNLQARESFSDLVQTVCLEVMRDVDQFEYQGEGAFRSWLFQRALHRILNKHRFHGSQKRDLAREVSIDAPASEGGEARSGSRDEALARAYARFCSPSQEAASNEALQEFEQALDRLPEDHREAILLHKIVGLNHAEIARQMERTEGAVRNLVYRGLARLSSELMDDEDESAEASS